jgi:PAS domain S-box-containing protein
MLHRGSGDGLPPVLLASANDSSRAALERLEHEYALRGELDPAWAARPLALSRHNDRWTLVLEDPGGDPLDRMLDGPLEPAEFLSLAIPLTRALRQMHDRGLIHKNIKPGNVLLDRMSGRVWLTGFGIASRLPREHHAPAPPEVIAGTLQYMAPEQTGRMNRSVDSRSDLYSLGVSFYEMLTGRLPFDAEDAMEWIHCHIARQTAPPDEHVRAIPKMISSIVMKLLAKTAEDRYQTAAGLEADLQRCLNEWKAFGRISEFPLGTRDLSHRLLIPERLYGRTREIESLLTAFGRVVSRGTTEVVLVSGYSGVGKSSIVSELHKALVSTRGLFAAGKFDQYQRDIPYSTVAQAFQSLLRPLLGQSQAELERWRASLRDALGPNAALVINLIPEIELIIGEQPPVTDLSPLETQKRFQMVFRHFVAVFARREHPLVLFLDDLQWMDTASLDLLQDLATHADVHDLLLIGAFRDNEIGHGHPLLNALDAIRKTRTPVNHIVIAPLAPADLNNLVADALRCEPAAAEPLGQLVHEKALGNPFFAIQLLEALCEEHLLVFDPHESIWKWDMHRIRDRGLSGNVIDLTVQRLARLPADSQEAVKQLACLGNTVSIRLLTMALDKAETHIHDHLRDVVRAGLLLRVGEHYAFAHDRVQEAAYALIDEGKRAALHLQMGRRLAAHTPPHLGEERVFEIVNQLNRGAALIQRLDEREQLAALNLTAGRRAKAATAYTAALNYLIAGEAMLTSDRWDRTHGLAFALAFHRAECAFLTGDPATAEQDLAALTHRAATLTDLTSVACLRIAVSMTTGASQHAIQVGLQCLESLGISWTSRPSDSDVEHEYGQIQRQLSGREIETLVDLPAMIDPRSRATMDVLVAFIPAAHWIDKNLYCLIIGRMTNLGLEHGNDAGSCIAYAYLGAVLGPHFGDYQTGYRFGKLALELVEKRRLDRFKHRVYAIFGHHTIPWMRHLNSGRGLLKRAADTAHEAGDLTFEVFSRMNLTTNLMSSGDPLEACEHAAERALALAQRARYGLVVELITGQLRLIRTLRGRASGTFADLDHFNFEQSLESAPAILACWHWIRMLQACFFAGEIESAITAAEKAGPLLWTSPSFFETAEYHFYAALARASCCDAAPESLRPLHLEALHLHHRQIAAWAENCPANFANRLSLVSAEIARLEGHDVDAMRLYEQAIQSSREGGFIQNEALADELASRFYRARDFPGIARPYLRAARDCYARWGAAGKVRRLEASFPDLADDSPPPLRTTTIGASVEHLDLATIMKVSQEVSGEIVLDQLIDRLMRTALEHAGAERALLISERDGSLQLEAEAATVHDAVTVRLRPGRELDVSLPESMLQHVLRTRETVLLDDALVQSAFSEDQYLRRNRLRSVLCLPLIKQTKLIGVLYLENSLTPGVFTPARNAVLTSLASQAAISLENAYLYYDLQHAYADLKQENSERRRAEDALRRSEAYLNEAQNLSRTGSFGWNTSSGEINWSGEAFRIFEFDPSVKPNVELLMRERVHPDDADDFAAVAARASQNGQDFSHEYRIRLPDHRIKHIRVAAHGIRSAHGDLEFVGAVVDITERKRAEEELRRSEEQWRDVFENNPTMYFMVDARGTILAVNPLGAEQLGYRAAELVSRPVLSVIHELDRDVIGRNLDGCLKHLGMPHSWEARKVCKDGRTVWVRETAKAVPRMSGAIVLVACEDITERKQVEAEKERLETQLRQSQKMEAMGTLAGGIAHDFNNILGAILGYGELVQQAVAENTDVRRYIDNVMQAGGRAKSLVERILAFSRSGLSERNPVDVQSVIAETIELLAAASLAPGVRLETRLDAAGAAILGDATQLHQVTMNLCTNALQAMESGGLLTVTLDRVDVAGERPLSHGTLIPGAYLQLRVKDTGGGIPPEVLDRMFDPFFTTKDVGKGTGLGLSLVHGIVADLGGAIDVSTAIRVGTTFAIWLPSRGEAVADPPLPMLPLPHGQGQTVLVVDNEQSLVALAEETLAELGYEPVGFSSSAAALRAFRDSPQRFDIVLTDESMPEFAGTALATEIGLLRPDLPIVLMSGFAGAQLQERVRALGIRDLLRKPLQRKDLAECFRRVLSS